MKKIAKGNYYRNKTKKYLEKRGFIVEKLEVPKLIFTKTGKVIHSHYDVWGGDLIAIKNNKVIVIQNKSNITDISKGIKELMIAPWPETIEKWVVYWEKNCREPVIKNAKNKRYIKITKNGKIYESSKK